MTVLKTIAGVLAYGVSSRLELLRKGSQDSLHIPAFAVYIRSTLLMTR